jgi:hypothetical protein
MSALDEARQCLAHPLTIYAGHELRKIIAGLVKQIEDRPQVPLAKKHEGMRIDASGLLGRIRDGKYHHVHQFGCGEMLRHLEAMAEQYYAGNIAFVDEFLQCYCLDNKRPQQGDDNG